MSFILTLIVCSATSGQCLAPYKVDKFYKDGYEISKKKTEAIGREEINKQKIYIKFGCYEDNSNKTPASYIIIK